MKRMLIISAGVILTLLAAYAAYFVSTARGIPVRVNGNFATRAVLRYHYDGKAIDREITDPVVLKSLKGVLSGWAIPERGYSGLFDLDVSVTMTDGQRRIVFCPACDTSSAFRIGGTNRNLYVSEARMDRFHAVVRKYGMVFPCL